jgi:pimeloyl-ACP methyl ester carboxylesterase
LALAACRKTATWSDNSPHKSGFVTVNGVRLNYLDWGGSGPALMLIHGGGDNPQIFDDLAPAFTDRFRVVAYARRGHGQSEAKGPYDTATLTEDL